jgi:PAS domain S-box-containing protein
MFINFFQFLDLIGLIIFICLAVYVLIKNPKSLLNRFCAALNFSFAIWSFGYIFIHDPSATREAVYFFMNIASLGFFTFSTIFLGFALVFSQKERFLRKRWFQFIAIILPLSLIYTQWTTNQFLADYVKQYYGWSYVFAETVWPLVFYVHYSSFMFLGFFLIYRFGKKSDNPVEKKQAKIIFISTLIALILGSMNSVIIQELNIHSVPSMAHFFALIWAGGLVYAITKHKFLTVISAIAADNIIRTMADCLIIADRERKTALFSDSTLRTLGYKGREMLNQPLSKVFAEKESESEIIGKLEGNDYIRDYETHVSAMDGRRIPVSINGSVIKDKGSVLGYLIIMRDMTETRGLIDELEENKKELDKKMGEMTGTKTAVLNMMEDMEETNRQLVNIQEELEKSLKELREMDIKKDQFISIAAHELKTPLTSIHGFSQLLQNRKVSNNFTKRSKYLKIMDHETKRLAKLVNDILDLSRIDLGTVKFSLDGVDLNRLIEDVKKEMDVQINEKGLKSEYDVEKGMPKIITDREKLTEILLNIINNAVKYTPTGKISVKAFKEKEGVHFIIKDTGIGIAKENQKKIFERFYQVDSSYSRKAGGTGLGLALCSEFIGFLGGKLWIKSELGKGSEFHFTMPLKCAPKGRVEVERGKERLEKAKELSKGLEGAKDMSKSLEEMGIEKENPKAFQGNSNK